MLEKMLFVRIATRIQWPEGSASIMFSKINVSRSSSSVELLDAKLGTSSSLRGPIKICAYKNVTDESGGGTFLIQHSFV